MKNILRNILLWTLVLAIMVLIFFFSQENGNASGSRSGVIVNFIYNIIKPITNGTEEFVKNVLSIIVRKGAHFSIYACLGLSLYFALKYTFKPWWCFLLMLPITFIYALVDEFHQTFIDGRSGQFTDSLIDTAGSLLILLIVLPIEIKRRKSYGN